MKNCIILGVMLLGFWGLYVAFHTPPALADGASLRRNCGAAIVWNDVACQSYVGGIAEGITISSHPAICLPAGFGMGEALAVVRRYMARHPRLAGDSSPLVVEDAFRAAYPCRQRSESVTARSD